MKISSIIMKFRISHCLEFGRIEGIYYTAIPNSELK